MAGGSKFDYYAALLDMAAAGEEAARALEQRGAAPPSRMPDRSREILEALRRDFIAPMDSGSLCGLVWALQDSAEALGDAGRLTASLPDMPRAASCVRNLRIMASCVRKAVAALPRRRRDAAIMGALEPMAACLEEVRRCSGAVRGSMAARSAGAALADSLDRAAAALRQAARMLYVIGLGEG